MRKMALFLAVLIATVSFAYISPLLEENPAFYDFESRSFFGVYMTPSLTILQNFFTLEELDSIANGTGDLVIDKTRLQYLDKNMGFVLGLPLGLNTGIYFGLAGAKMGFDLDVEGNMALGLPYEFFQVLTKDVDYEENIDKKFNFLVGGIYAKAGMYYGQRLNLGRNTLAFSAFVGGFLPVFHTDETKTMRFYYISDPNQATLELGFDGYARLLSGFSKDEFNFDSLGYFADLGLVWKMELGRNASIYAGFAAKNITLASAKATAEATAAFVMSMSVQNGEVNTGEPDFSFNEPVSLETPEEVKLPMYYTVQAGGNFGPMEAGIHASFGEHSYNNYGFYLGIFRFLWMDFTNFSEYSLWKASVGLDLDLRILKLAVSLGGVSTAPWDFSHRGYGISAAIAFGF